MVIKKIGIDIVTNKRIKKLVENEKFINRILSTDEQDIFYAFRLEKRRIEYLAGRFTCKEAFAKATEKTEKEFNFNSVSILNKEDGTPYLKGDCNNLIVHLSISHCDEYTVSLVIIEEN